ncbi:hypothetical protein ACTJLB_25990, partial [Paraburkholderia sp. 22098]|uniref:hypothetical protein n=1 Tax=Paraburkholderia sp. 22098 TaxID=3453874 RepID=UPI003F837917
MVFGWLFADVVVDESSPGNVPSRSIVDDFSVGVERPLLADSVEKVVLWLGAQKLATRFRVVALSEVANLNQAAIPRC